jgi:hypothetical protein
MIEKEIEICATNLANNFTVPCIGANALGFVGKMRTVP